MAVQLQERHSPVEYLALERGAEWKSEYINGVIVAMARATREHILITGNCAGELRALLKGRPCETYAADMRVKVSATGLYTYPDVVVACGELQFEDARQDTLLNPTLIIEVLSESTEAYDRGAKFGHYRRVESLQEYILVAQDRVSVERFVRQGDDWLLTVIEDIGGTVGLASIGCDVALREIYDRIQFAGTDAGAAGSGVTDG
jgi:Uma2 family endonuclease